MEMKIDDIELVAIIVQFKDGNAHQVLASNENKQIYLRMLATMEGSLKLTKEILPVEFTLK